jgi:hypothetical protein
VSCGAVATSVAQKELPLSLDGIIVKLDVGDETWRVPISGASLTNFAAVMDHVMQVGPPTSSFGFKHFEGKSQRWTQDTHQDAIRSAAANSRAGTMPVLRLAEFHGDEEKDEEIARLPICRFCGAEEACHDVHNMAPLSDMDEITKYVLLGAWMMLKMFMLMTNQRAPLLW